MNWNYELSLIAILFVSIKLINLIMNNFVKDSVGDPFWGPPTSTIDWCEENYIHTRFIAEPLNTVSNLSFIIFGIVGMLHESGQTGKGAYVFLHSIILLIGIGSMAFHATLTYVGQQLDELPMVFYLLSMSYIIFRDSLSMNKRQYLAAFLMMYAIVFSYVHIKLQLNTLFQVHFIALLVSNLALMYYKFRYA